MGEIIERDVTSGVSFGSSNGIVLRAAQRVGFTVCSIYKLLLRYYSYRRKRKDALADSCAEIWAENSLVPDPSVQAHARTRITACACGKEGSGEMDGLRTGKSWNVKTVLECN